MRVRNINEDEQNKLIEELRELVFPNHQPFTLYDLDHDIEKQKRIMAMSEALRNAFHLHHETALQKPHSLKRPWLSLVKSFIGKRYEFVIEDYRDKQKSVRTKRYHIKMKTI